MTKVSRKRKCLRWFSWLVIFQTITDSPLTDIATRLYLLLLISPTHYAGSMTKWHCSRINASRIMTENTIKNEKSKKFSIQFSWRGPVKCVESFHPRARSFNSRKLSREMMLESLPNNWRMLAEDGIRDPPGQDLADAEQ